MKRFICLTLLLISSGTTFFGQPPEETPEQREARIREEIRVLEARIKYLNTIRSAAGSSDITAATSGGTTTFASASQPNLETVSLSYEALKEISELIDRELRPTISAYKTIVIHNEPDFAALTRYRLYREQIRQALANYEAIVERIQTVSVRSTAENSVSQPRSVRTMGPEALVTALNAPSIATSAIKSFAELASLFRTDQTITESRDVVDRNSLGAVVAGTFLKANPNLGVYHPEQFVADYNIGTADTDSLYTQLARINAAEAYLNYFLDEVRRLPAGEREAPPLSRIIAAATVVQEQISRLGFPVPAERAPAPEAGSPRVSELRAMLRAEKLDRVLTSQNGRVGIIKLRLLSSGGARRDKRNLLLGGKTDYSGSAVVEAALYDADGTLRASEVFAYHTGFRRFRTNEKPGK